MHYAHIEPPLPQNPYIENVNASTILFRWSAPYLWPGYSIECYKISINGTTVKWINATVNDLVVSYLKTADGPNDIQSCNELTFSISATSNIDGYHSELRSFTAVGGYLPGKRQCLVYNALLFTQFSDTTSLDINITVTVLFHVDRLPLVMVKVIVSYFLCSVL